MRRKISPRHQVERKIKVSSWLSFDNRLHISRDLKLTSGIDEFGDDTDIMLQCRHNGLIRSVNPPGP